ncbi:sorting nexin-14-like [Sarcoptes scabiei]|nr:sorting nexin-14-like [Sarcoptes scabiei]
MEHGFSSLSINTIDPNRIDPNEFFNQQKEIEGLLSNAFDDITSIQHLSDNENDDDDTLDRHFRSITKPSRTKKSPQSNGFNASTPLTNNHNSNAHRIQLKDFTTKFKNKNFHDIVEEDTINDIDSLENDDNDLLSDLSLSDSNDRIKHLPNGHSETLMNLRNSESAHSDTQLKDLCILKEEVTQITKNHEILKQKYSKLQQLNYGNIQLIESLKSRINSLEEELHAEKEENVKERRQSVMLESKIISLEYQLSETQKSDFVTRNNEDQIKWFESLKAKHQKEIYNLRNDYEKKIENLNQIIASKDEELINNCNLIRNYKQEVNFFQEKYKKIESETKSLMRKEIDDVKDRVESNLLKSFDSSVVKLKNEWEQKLREDIDKIVQWFDNWESNQTSTDNLDFRFSRLIDLCDSLKRSNRKQEQHIQSQIDRLEEARRQLEKALLEVKMRNTSLSSTSSRSDLLADDGIINPSNNNANFLIRPPTKDNHNHLNHHHSNHNNQMKKYQTKTLIELNDQINDESNHFTNDVNNIIVKSSSTSSLNNEICNNNKKLLKNRYEKELKEIRENFEMELKFLKDQLLDKEEEALLLKRKSNKYKQHYQQLVDKHKQELSLLKNEFTKVMQNLLNSRDES